MASPRRKLVNAVVDSLRAVDMARQDEAAAQLAIVYAGAIDAGDLSVGPALLATLEALQLTPRARAKLTKGLEHEPRPVSPLDQLRERRASRRG